MKKILFVLVLFCMNMMAFAQEDAPAGVPVGTAAPEFALPTLKGDIVKLSDYKGKYVIVDFWASWCGDCRREMPSLITLYNDCHKKGVEFLGISYDNDAAKMKAAIEKYQIPWTQVSELKSWKSTEIDKLYKITWIPAFYLINPEGKVQAYATTVESLKKALTESIK